MKRSAETGHTAKAELAGDGTDAGLAIRAREDQPGTLEPAGLEMTSDPPFRLEQLIERGSGKVKS